MSERSKEPWCPTCGWGAPCVEEPAEVIRARIAELRRPDADRTAFNETRYASGEIEGLEFALRALGVET